MHDCDFIPARYREARAMRRAIRLRASCVGVLIAIMLIWVGSHRHRLATVKGMMVDVAGQEQQVRIHLAKKVQMDAERARLFDRQRLIEQLREGVDLVVVLSDISRRIPKAVVLTELSARCATLGRYVVAEESTAPMSPEEEMEQLAAAMPRPSIPGLRLPGSPQQPPKPRVDEADGDCITIVGMAREVPEVIEFAAALESSRLYRRVQMEMKEPTTWGGKRAQRFEIRCDLAKQAGEPQ